MKRRVDNSSEAELTKVKFKDETDAFLNKRHSLQPDYCEKTAAQEIEAKLIKQASIKLD